MIICQSDSGTLRRRLDKIIGFGFPAVYYIEYLLTTLISQFAITISQEWIYYYLEFWKIGIFIVDANLKSNCPLINNIFKNRPRMLSNLTFIHIIKSSALAIFDWQSFAWNNKSGRIPMWLDTESRMDEKQLGLVCVSTNCSYRG
jgi:hypothetical protein